MERAKIQCDLWVPASIEAVWDFMSKPANLAALTPDFYHIHIPADAKLENGAELTMTMSPYGIPLKLTWVSVFRDIVSEGPLRQFVDAQVKGPFALWKHQHQFEKGIEVIEGLRSNSKVKVHQPGCWIRDRVDYAAPLSFLGTFANWVYVERSLEKLFAFRNAKLREHFAVATMVEPAAPPVQT